MDSNRRPLVLESLTQCDQMMNKKLSIFQKYSDSLPYIDCSLFGAIDSQTIIVALTRAVKEFNSIFFPVYCGLRDLM